MNKGKRILVSRLISLLQIRIQQQQKKSLISQLIQLIKQHWQNEVRQILQEGTKSRQQKMIIALNLQRKKLLARLKGWREIARKRRRKYHRLKNLLEEIRRRLIKTRLASDDWRLRTKEVLDFCDWLLKKLPLTPEEVALIAAPPKERGTGIFKSLYRRLKGGGGKKEEKK